MTACILLFQSHLLGRRRLQVPVKFSVDRGGRACILTLLVHDTELDIAFLHSPGAYSLLRAYKSYAPLLPEKCE